MKIRQLRQVTLALLATTAFAASHASASEYTVSGATTVKNGDVGNVLDGNDTLTILSSGSITTNAGNAVEATGPNNTITNSGSIVSNSVASYGIFAFEQSNITNAGTITTNMGNSWGIGVQNNNTVSNSGTITVLGNNSGGILAGSDNTVTNTGNIVTFGSGSFGILAGNNSAIVNDGNVKVNGNGSNGIDLTGLNAIATNNGTIEINGDNTFGMASSVFGVVAVDSNNTLTNTGTIIHNGIGAGMGAFPNSNKIIVNNSGTIVTNAQAYGIVVLNDSIVNNTGSILTKGTLGHGIIAGIGNRITNSGKIVAEQADAIIFSGSDNQLILNAPSFIGGRINMGNTNAVDVVTGRSHSVLWDFSTHGANFNSSFSGPVPWAWDATTEQFATLDPTALSAAPDILADMVSTLSDLTRNERNNEWWLQGYGNFSSTPATGIYNDYTALNGGIATGASFVLNENADLGVFVGYQASSLNVNSRWVTSQTINSNGVVGGIYGTARMNNIFLDLALYAGWSANSSDRFVNDNLQALGQDHALASFNSWFLSPEARVGVNIDTGDIWTMTPSATARFSNQWINGYTETGTNANATVGARQVQVFEGELELAATRNIQNGTFGMRGGVQFRQALGAATQDITLLGQTLAMPLDMSSSLAGYVGVDASYNINEASTLNVAAKASYGARNSFNIAGSIGFNSEF